MVERRVLVTGASRGIGRAIALELARAGFRVALNYRANRVAAEEVLQMIEEEGGRAYSLCFDVSQREEARRVLAEDRAENGVFWGVVLNAGIHADAPFPALKEDDWDRVLRTNLDGFFNVLQPMIMPMIRAKAGGRIVAMSSISGLVGNRGQVNYSASKGGIIAAVKSLSRELAKRQITVNSVAPGIIETDMTAELPMAEVIKNIPMRRLGKPEEVAGVVGFLFSQAAAYITGEVISVNGGLL